MRVCLPLYERGIGGPATFAAKLHEGLAARGMQVVRSISENPDAVLAIVSAPIQALLQAKRRGVPIVQRLDGVYYPASSGWRWWMLNIPIRMVYRRFADHVVYQSEYSRIMCEHFLGRSRCPTSTVYNGVDLTRFRPQVEAEKPSEGMTLLCLLATFWREHEITPVIEAYDGLRVERPDARLRVVGRLVPSIRHIATSRPDLMWTGQLPHEELPAVYRSADVLLSSKLRAPCPNALIEALACGLPVACFDSGAHRELVGQDAGICVPLEDSFGRFPELSGAALADAASRILRDRSKYSAAARRRAEQRFGLDQMVEGYLGAFEEAIGTRGS